MTTKFKTNIKCGNCVATVTPHLNEVAGAGNWEVDLNNPERILTVTGPEEEKIEEALKKAGYQGVRISA